MQEQNVGRDLRVGGFGKSAAWQAHRAQQVGPLGQVFPHRRILLVHGTLGGNKCHDAPSSYLVQRFCEEIIVDQKTVLLIARVRQAIVAEGDIAHRQVYGVVRQIDVLKAADSDIGLWIKLFGNASGDAVQLYAVKLCVPHSLRQQTKKITHTHSRLQHGSRLNTHTGEGIVNALNDQGRGVMGVQGRTTGSGIFIRCQQLFQFLILLCPFFIVSVESLRNAAPAGIAGKNVLLRRACLPLFCFQCFQKPNGSDVVLILHFLAACANVRVSDAVILRHGLSLTQLCSGSHGRVGEISEVQLPQFPVDQLPQTFVVLLPGHNTIHQIIHIAAGQVSLHLHLMRFVLGGRVGQPHMARVYLREVRLRAVFVPAEVRDQALGLCQQRVLGGQRGDGDGIQRGFVFRRRFQVCVLLLLYPFPHSRDRFGAENGKTGAACKGIIPQADAAGAVIHAVHGKDAVIFRQLHTDRDKIRDAPVNDHIIAVAVFPGKYNVKAVKLQCFSRRRPAVGKAGKHGFAQAGDITGDGFSVQLRSNGRGILAAEQEVTAAFHAHHRAGMLCFQSEIGRAVYGKDFILGAICLRYARAGLRQGLFQLGRGGFLPGLRAICIQPARAGQRLFCLLLFCGRREEHLFLLRGRYGHIRPLRRLLNLLPDLMGQVVVIEENAAILCNVGQRLIIAVFLLQPVPDGYPIAQMPKAQVKFP